MPKAHIRERHLPMFMKDANAVRSPSYKASIEHRLSSLQLDIISDVFYASTVINDTEDVSTVWITNIENNISALGCRKQQGRLRSMDLETSTIAQMLDLLRRSGLSFRECLHQYVMFIWSRLCQFSRRRECHHCGAKELVQGFSICLSNAFKNACTNIE